jgi:hypothetical protein
MSSLFERGGGEVRAAGRAGDRLGSWGTAGLSARGVIICDWLRSSKCKFLCTVAGEDVLDCSSEIPAEK